MKTFVLPDLGEGLQDAEIVAWHITVGDRVVADQPLVSVETEKAVVEVPSPWSGRITELHAKPGDIVGIGEALVNIDGDERSDDAGAVVGQLPRASGKGTKSQADAQRSASSPSRSKAAPAVRKLAAELGIDLADIIGTGPLGAVMRADVEAAARNEGANAYVPLRGARRTMARKVAQAHAEVATTSVTDEADISCWPEREDITRRLVRAMIAGCRIEPALNAWYDGKRNARLVHDRIDLGIAVNTEDGLFVPVLRDAGRVNEEELRAALQTMKTYVTARTAPPEILRNATLTLSNFGMLGGRHASMVVIPPQVAIVGAGRITSEARIVDEQIKACHVLPLSLTFDHRAVTGAEAIRFLSEMIKDLEE